MSNDSKIVIVDDDEIVTSSLKTFLSFEDFRNVEYFNNPKEALEFVKLEKPDLVISDFIMPNMNGIEFLSEVKKIYPELSLILLTGYADKENAIKAINEVGIYRYLEKPWDNDDLLINIKNGIERSHLYDELNKKIEELEDHKKNLENIVAQRTAELSNAYSKMEAIFANCADGIIVINSNGEIQQTNNASETLFGLGQKMLVQKNITELITEKNGKNILNLLKSDEEIFLRDVFLYNEIKEKKIPVEISFAPIETENNDNFVGVIRDVSLQAEMNRLRDDFIATLTHDLKTPLLAAIQTLGYFADGALGEVQEGQKKLISAMKRSNEDMLGLVNALLEVYKYESGKLDLCKTNFDFNSLAEECYENLKPLATKKNLDFQLHIDTTKNITIFADRNEIRRVIINLCGNAIKFTNEGKSISIKTAIENSDLQFSVKDDGIGIPKSDIPKMFKRFSQGTSDKRSTGTGLGLYLSRQIIEAHNGKIWVISEKNEGSEFLFLLPDSIKIKAGV